MKIRLSILLCFLCGILPAQSPQTTQYFAFHNHYWVNLHHFLYQQAKGSQVRKLAEDGDNLLDLGEAAIFTGLGKKDQHALQEAIAYYQDSLVDKNLRLHQGELRVWLQEQTELQISQEAPGYPGLREQLHKASDVYAVHFWPLHRQQNNKTLNQHLAIIKELETVVFPRMEKLAANTLPTDHKIRVDLTAYANYAGAYTATKPRFNIFVSTLDPGSRSSDIIETFFHEGSHLLFGFGSPFPSSLYQASQRLDKKSPRGLWHACLFYLCGKVVQGELKKKGITHSLTMDARDIFHDLNTPILRDILDLYMEGVLSLEEMAEEMLTRWE